MNFLAMIVFINAIISATKPGYESKQDSIFNLGDKKEELAWAMGEKGFFVEQGDGRYELLLTNRYHSWKKDGKEAQAALDQCRKDAVKVKEVVKQAKSGMDIFNECRYERNGFVLALSIKNLEKSFFEKAGLLVRKDDEGRTIFARQYYSYHQSEGLEAERARLACQRDQEDLPTLAKENHYDLRMKQNCKFANGGFEFTYSLSKSNQSNINQPKAKTTDTPSTR